MINRFHWSVATRYAGARKRGQLASFISGLSIAGIMVGVALLLIVTSVMNGFEKELEERILGIVPHGAIYHRRGIENWPEFREILVREPGIVEAAPFIELQAMVTHGQQVTPVLVYGVDPELEQKISIIDEFVESSILDQLTDDDFLILGSGVAKQLGLVVGDRLSLLVPDRQGRGSMPQVQTTTLLAVVHSGTELDHALAMTSLGSAAKLIADPHTVSGLRIKFNDVFAAEDRILDISRNLPYGFYGRSWTHSHGNLYHAIQMSKSMISLLLMLIIAIAAFNVVATLIMVVIDKQGDIAIMRSMGASQGDILLIFLLYGSLIGGIGTILGLVGGYAGAHYIQDLVRWVEQLMGSSFLNSDVYPIDYIPSKIFTGDFIGVAIVALVLCLIASIYPAWKASRMEPAEVLKHE